jgi:hypothetical protein
MTAVPDDMLAEVLADAAAAAAAVANYCDHAEHLEATDRAEIITAGETYRRVAATLSEVAGLDLLDAYAQRLAVIERRNVLSCEASFDGAAAALAAATWADLQRVQVAHDRAYHPDVLGLARIDQLRHYAFHLSKLVGALADLGAGRMDWDSFVATRLPDLLLFGIKLATVANSPLPDEPLSWRNRGADREPSADRG